LAQRSAHFAARARGALGAYVVHSCLGKKCTSGARRGRNIESTILDGFSPGKFSGGETVNVIKCWKEAEGNNLCRRILEKGITLPDRKFDESLWNTAAQRVDCPIFTSFIIM
jgi:hypothetical protein